MFLLILFVIARCHCYRCPEMYEKYDVKQSRYRLSSIANGNFTIQALVPVSNSDSNCGAVLAKGLGLLYSLKYSLEKANESPLLRKWHTVIGLRIDDSCRSLPVAMTRGMEVISLLNPNTICREDFLHCSVNRSSYQLPSEFQVISGIIGTSYSSTSIPLASLTALYQIPQLSYGASSRLLSNPVYNSFFRTIPSDDNQVMALIDILERFNWNFVFAVGSDDDYGELGVSELKSRSWSKEICIADHELIPFDEPDTLTRIQEVVKNIKSKENAQVVVLFCYLTGMGDLILEEAQRQGVRRIWLTSEAWNPVAENLNVDTLLDQSQGILTVSLKRYPMPWFTDYIRKKVRTDFQCNMWLKNFLRNTYNCSPLALSQDKKTLNGSRGCKVRVDDVVSEIRSAMSLTSNSMNAIRALTEGIVAVLRDECGSNAMNCSLDSIIPKILTSAMHGVNFTGVNGDRISFKDGELSNAYYSIENLQYIDGKLRYIPVGNWSSTRGLLLDDDKVKWPAWFKDDGFPISLCSARCVPGEVVSAIIGCCWKCNKCTGMYYTDTPMSRKCIKCPDGHHTVDHIKCTQTPVVWMTHESTEGMAIVVTSSVGLFLLVICSCLLFQYRTVMVKEEKFLHIITITCILLYATFAFGFLYVLKPTPRLCLSRNVLFFLVLMSFSSLLLIKSRVVQLAIQTQAASWFHNRSVLLQCLFLVFLLLIEVASVLVWVFFDSQHNLVQSEMNEKVFEMEWRCDVKLTSAKLVSIFIPCVLLIVATFFAFRERNLKHAFYEPKFLSFTCIALCIATVAFLPAFQYVSGNFKCVVMEFTTCVFAYACMICLLVPKIYMAQQKSRLTRTFNSEISVNKSEQSTKELPMKDISDTSDSRKEFHDFSEAKGYANETYEDEGSKNDNEKEENT